MNREEWEQHFCSVKAKLAGSPDPLVEKIAAGFLSVSFKHALDLACGAGANAVWLAEHGWHVTAVDRSRAAIELVRARAAERGVTVNTHAGDLERHEFEIEAGAWDLILMCRYLQRDLFEPAMAGLKPGGVLIVIALLAEGGPQNFRVEAAELAAFFGNRAGWTVLHLREGATRGHRVAEIALRRDG